jgi:hypothetical protein
VAALMKELYTMKEPLSLVKIVAIPVLVPLEK